MMPVVRATLALPQSATSRIPLTPNLAAALRTRISARTLILKMLVASGPGTLNINFRNFLDKIEKSDFGYVENVFGTISRF